MPAIYWSDYTKVSYLQRRIIVHSIIYYELNTNVISDYNYDMLAKQLFEMQNKLPVEEFKKTRYYYLLKDFNGITGFYLYLGLNEKDSKHLMNIAKSVVESYERKMQND